MYSSDHHGIAQLSFGSYVIRSPFICSALRRLLLLLLLHTRRWPSSVTQLAKGKFSVKPYWGCDLGSEHERYLTEQVFKKPLILTNYPKDIKAFYMKQNADGKTGACS